MLQQIPRPDAFIACFPGSIALQTGHGAHALLAARAPLYHALQRFETVKTENLDLTA